MINYFPAGSLDKLLIAAKEALADARRAIQRTYEMGYVYSPSNPDPEHEEEMAFEDIALREALDRAHLSISCAFELVGLKAAVERVDSAYAALSSVRCNVRALPWVGDPINDSELLLGRNLKSLEFLLPGGVLPDAKVNRDKIEEILKSTPVLLREFGVEPKNEAEVQSIMHKLLGVYFPDARREVSILQPSKVYRADIGILSLNMLVEYKFAPDDVGIGNFLGGLYEDSWGYAGDANWQHFVGVIYMGGPFWRQSAVDAEMKNIGFSEKWRIYVVHGPAQPKTPKQKPKSSF